MTSHASEQALAKSAWWGHPRVKKVLLCGVFSTICVFTAWLIWFRPYVSTDDARIAATMVRIAPEGTSGHVTQLNAKEGDRVKKGMTLLELDHEFAEAQLERAKARAALAAREMKRIEQLAAERGVAQKELDNAQASFQVAHAELRLAEIALARTFLKSPIDGIVVQKTAEVGNILEPGQTALTIAETQSAWVAANIEETRIGEVQVGQPVSIRIDEGGELSGRVSEIREATASQFALIPAESTSGNFTKVVQRIPIKVQLDPHPNRTLRAGQSVEIKIRVR